MKDITQYFPQNKLKKMRAKAIEMGTYAPEGVLNEVNVKKAMDVVDKIPAIINKEWWLAMNRNIYVSLFIEMIDSGVDERVAEGLLVCAFYLKHLGIDQKLAVNWYESAMHYAEQGIEYD